MSKSTKSPSAEKLTQLRKSPDGPAAPDTGVHVYGNKVRCDTETRGFPTPKNLSTLELVLDASEGFIPLWKEHTTLRWKFRDSAFEAFENPTALKAEVRKLFAEALVAWGDAAPVTFTEQRDVWDFEIIVNPQANCNASGCVLARAFFPDAGRHDLMVYPTMFSQSRAEQIETLCHEIGHVFGLRHFFAQIREAAAPSVIFGKHNAFSIMNYGAQSVLTQDDRMDLKRLYRGVWEGTLTEINGTPIKLVDPYHSLAGASVVPAIAALREPNVPLNRRVAMCRF